MSILGPLDATRFIDEHWQREPLLVRGAIDGAGDLVDGDELAGLACEEGVESRIVIHDPHSGGWRCEDGPFEEARFARLPRSGWTLLVQAVDQWLPRVADLLTRVDFLPRWRMDDVMVSYAVDGGGVGPHFDHYDVFLVQASGRRRWRLGQRCDAASPLREHPDLMLLERFEPDADHLLEPGDLLYVPPGLAHWGTAAGDDCITCSVGFRAPSLGDIVQGAAARLAEGLGEGARYRDTRASIDRDPYRINAAALAGLRTAWETLAPAAVDAALAESLGCQVTEPRHPEMVGAAAGRDPGAAARRLAAGGDRRIVHDPASRLAYTADGGRAVLFVDGEAHHVSTALARAVCHGVLCGGTALDDEDRSVLLRLVSQGSVTVT